MISYLLGTTVVPPGAAALMCCAFRRAGLPYDFCLGWAGAAIGGAAACALSGARTWAAVDVANALLAALLWWLSRRRRKRAPRAYGLKSLALVAAIVAKLRESLRPRTVLRPVPGGVR